MISGLDELSQANALVEEYKGELRAEGMPFDDKLEIGAMIEMPSAALIAADSWQAAEVFQHRHQRSDSILAGRGSDERKNCASVRADAPGHRAV